MRLVVAAALMVAAGLLWWLADGDDVRRAQTELRTGDFEAERPSPPATPETVEEDDEPLPEAAALPPDCVGGTAWDADREPIPGVKVHLQARGGDKRSWDTQTDRSGGFLIPNIPGGEYRLAATHADHAALAFDFRRTGERGTDLEFRMEPRESILVRVLGPQGAPLPALRILLCDEDGATLSEGRTNSEGRLLLENLAKPRYWIECHLHDGVCRRRIDPPKDVLFISNSLLRGTVLDGNGNPVVGAVVKLLCHPVAHGQARTDPGGRYELRGLPPAEYELWLWLQDAWRTKLVLGGVQLPGGVHERSIRLPRTEIRGRVTRAGTGEPLPTDGARIEIYARGQEGRRIPEASARTSKQGCYCIRGLLPGSYTVWVLSRGPEEFVLEDWKLDLRAGESVRDLDFAVRSPPHGRVLVVATDEAGRPVHGMTFSLAARPHQGFHEQALGDGRYELELGAGPRPLCYRGPCASGGSTGVCVVAGTTIELPLLLPGPGPRPGSD